jgi:hypothetical protein
MADTSPLGPGRPEPVARTTRAGVTRVYCHVPQATDEGGPTFGALRPLLVADTMVRAAELTSTHVRLAWGLAEPPDAAARLRATLAGWQVRPAPRHPPADTVEGVTALLGGTPTLWIESVARSDSAARLPPSTRLLVTGAVRSGDAEAPATLGTGGPLDPLAVRLALLTASPCDPVVLDAALRAADGRLARWRTAVARWSTSPSAAMPADYVARIRATFTDVPDTPAILRLLEQAELDDGVLDGAKFELFVWADRVLALDVARGLGSAAPTDL